MGQIEIAFFNFGWICEVEIQIRSAAANMIKDWKRIYIIEIPQQQIKTSQELGNCPMGQREALLKERLYWRKGFIERTAFLKKGSIEKMWNLVKIAKFGQNCEIFPKNYEI